MADANENAPTDTASLKRVRRSSPGRQWEPPHKIRKAPRPPFEDVDTNVLQDGCSITVQLEKAFGTGDLTERRRLSKRVSFSDTNQINYVIPLGTVFEREQSGEVSNSTDNASASAVSGCGALPSAIVDDTAAKKEEADQLLQFECSAHEQSFYQGEDGESEDCSPLKKISPLEDALACLMFGRAGAPPGNATTSSAHPNRTTLAHESMDLTALSICDGAVSLAASPCSVHPNRTTLAHKSMDLTAVSICDGAVSPAPSPCAVHPNRTTLAHETMDLTQAAISVYDGGALSPSRAHPNRTMLAHKTMDLTRAAMSACDGSVSAEPTGTRFFTNLQMEITSAAFSPQPGVALPSGADATCYSPNTMNVACVTAEESLCGDGLPPVDRAASTHENHDPSPSVAEPAPLGSIFQMVSLKNNCRHLWWDESPGRKTGTESEATSSVTPGIETHSKVGTSEAEKAVDVTPVRDSASLTTNLQPAPMDITKYNASSRSHQTSLATQLGTLDWHTAADKAGLMVNEAGGGIKTAESAPVPSKTADSVAGGLSLRSPVDLRGPDAVPTEDDAGTLELDNSKAVPPALEGVRSYTDNHDCVDDPLLPSAGECGVVVGTNEASFGKTQHVSVMMDMTCASSRPALFAADPTDRELTSCTVMPLDGMEMTCAIPSDVTGMSMTCANMTGPVPDLLDTTCPSAEPAKLLSIGTPPPKSGNKASRDLGRGVGTASQLAVDTEDTGTGVEENAACSPIEDPRCAETLALYNAGVGHTSHADFTGGVQIEATVTKMHHSFAVSSSQLASIMTSPRNNASLGGGPQDVPLISEAKSPSFLECTPKRRHANAPHTVEAFARSGTPAAYTPSKRGNSASKRAGTPTQGVLLSSRESIALQLLVSPANKSVTRMRTPNQLNNAAQSPSSKCRSASLKKSFSAVHKIFNDVLDSTGHVPPGLDVSALLGTSACSISSVPPGLDVSALLATSTRSVHSLTLVDNVFSPARQSAQARNCMHSSTAGALERSAETSRQEKGASSSQMAEKHRQVAKSVANLDKTGAETGVRDQEWVGALPLKDSEGTKSSTSSVVESHPQAAAKSHSVVSKVHPAKRALATEAARVVDVQMQDGTLTGLSATCRDSASTSEMQRKSATFVVNARRDRSSATFVLDAKARPSATFILDTKARPSATFTVASPASSVLCHQDSSSGVDAAIGEHPLGASGPKYASGSSCSHSKQSGDEPNGESDHGNSTHSTITPKSRKRLQFVDALKGPAPERSEGRGGVSVSRSRQGTSTLENAVSRTTGPRRQLLDHDEPSGSQQPSGNRSDAADEEMLMDVAEPSFVSSSSDKSTQKSLPACQRDGANSDKEVTSLPAEQREVPAAGLPENKSPCDEKASPGTSPILASTFYSASSSLARKKSKRSPPPLQAKLSERGSSASKSRSAKGSRKRHLQTTPMTTDKRRKGSKVVRSSHRKTKNDSSKVSGSQKNTPKTSRRAAKSLGREYAAAASGDSSSESFSYGVRLPSLPTTPVEKEGGLEATQAQQVQNDPRSHAGATKPPAPMEFEDTDPDKELFDNVDPELNLTAGIDIEGILERLDDANVQESLYWSVYQLPKSLQEEWQLRICEALPHKAVFTFAGDVLELAVSLGDSVEQPGTCTDQAVKDAASGKVRRRTKRIAALRFRIARNAKCGPFSKFICGRLKDTYKEGELLLQRHPTTDSLGEMLSEVGAYFVRHRPLSQDIGRATHSRTRRFGYTFTDDSVLSIEVSHPRRCVWFHMDLPIDVDTYPHAEILPSSRPYSGPLHEPGDQYVVIKTEKLRRITAHVAPGPQYLTRIVDELEAFMNKR